MSNPEDTNQDPLEIEAKTQRRIQAVIDHQQQARQPEQPQQAKQSLWARIVGRLTGKQ